MQEDVGRKFRVGYYSPQDGLDCIWLVNEAAEYEQTADRQWLCDYFVLEWLSKETDYFGWTRPKLRKLTKSTLKSRGKRKKRKGGK